MDMKNIIEEIVNASQKTPEPTDRIGEDGLVYCGKCGECKEAMYDFGTEQMHKVHVMCRCEREAYQKQQDEFKRIERNERIERNKKICIQDAALIDSNFEHDDGSLPQLASARRYVDSWNIRKANNDGLLLWGDVGTGKTFYAACIANALIEKDVSVLMTNFTKILNSLSGSTADYKNAFVSDLVKYELLIIDDFGVERNTEFALEQVHNIIDERYKTKLPLIVTTNLTLNDFKTPQDTAHQRIYDRILSMCVPVRIKSENHRLKDRADKVISCRDLFEGTGR